MNPYMRDSFGPSPAGAEICCRPAFALLFSTCFPDREYRNLNNLILIRLRLARDARGRFANGSFGNPASLYFSCKNRSRGAPFGRRRADGPNPTQPTPVRHFGAPPDPRRTRPKDRLRPSGGPGITIAGPRAYCAAIPARAGSGDFPGAVRLQAAGEMVVLGVNGRAFRARQVSDFLALLPVQNQFPEQLDCSRVSRRRVAPGRFRADRLAVNLIGYGIVDHIEVLLGQRDMGLPG